MMRVLALIPGGIGDQILCFPTLDDLKQQYPDAQIDVVVEPKAKGAYRVCRAVQEVIPFDFQNRNGLADWVNLIGILREREYDAAIAFERGWEMGLLMWLTGIPTRISYAGGAGEFLLTQPVPLKPEQYAAQKYHDLLQGLGINTPCPELQINLPQKDLVWAETEQNRLDLADAKEGSYVLIDGGSSLAKNPSGDYPAKNWQKIIQDFQQRQPDLPVVVVEAAQVGVAALKKACPQLKVTAPEDTGKLAAMIAGASLVVSSNPAAVQLAVAVQTYTIALFGPLEPQKYLPQSDRFISIKAPSGKVADIPPEKVLEKVWSA